MIVIRLAQPTDAPTLLPIAQASILEGTQGIYTLAQRQAWAARLDTVAHWERVIQTQQVWVATWNATAVGFIAWVPPSYVDYLYVHPEAFRRGVARALYQTLLQAAHAQGAPRLYAKVSHVARPFFERMGWQVDRVQSVDLDGVVLTNQVMSIRLV